MIYLDNNATTPLDARVKEAVVREMEMLHGNPSSIHAFGQAVKGRLIQCRRLIAGYLDIKPHELLFTSSATEAVNMVMHGIKDGHLITSSVEHACTYEKAKELEQAGVEVTFLPVGLSGSVDPEDVKRAIRSNTRLIALMSVNNETGVKTDIEAIAEIAKERKIPFFVDAVALFGKEPMRVPSGVTALCLTGHKCHAPQGVAALFVRNTFKMKPLIVGGVQEYGKRGGTENLIGVVALAEAVRLLETELPAATMRMQALRDKLENALLEMEDVVVNGPSSRVVNTTNLAFKGVDGELLLALLDMEGVAASHGSACSAGALEPSRVLLNMGIAKEMAAASIRFSLSRFTTEGEIDSAIQIITQLVKKSRMKV